LNAVQLAGREAKSLNSAQRQTPGPLADNPASPSLRGDGGVCPLADSPASPSLRGDGGVCPLADSPAAGEDRHGLARRSWPKA